MLLGVKLYFKLIKSKLEFGSSLRDEIFKLEQVDFSKSSYNCC